MSGQSGGDGVIASAVELVAVEEGERLLAAGDEGAFTGEELRYAKARADPGRRLAARLAAKRAACRLLGGGAIEREVGVVRGADGPPSLRLSGAARQAMAALGATRALVSLTHERRQAAALVVLLRDER